LPDERRFIAALTQHRSDCTAIERDADIVERVGVKRFFQVQCKALLITDGGERGPMDAGIALIQD
jgi:hypothetical protein